MDVDCSHIPADLAPPNVTAKGCEDCIAAGKRDWVHLRMCQVCGRIGCCNDSPSTHATKHYQATGHALMRSFEPGEDWWYCFVDDVGFHVEGSPGAPSYTDP